MTLDGQLPRPDRARRPVITETGLRCRRLAVDESGPRPSDEDSQLLRKHSPELVILPEADAAASTPYPNGTRDYQPHSVDLYLEDIRTVRQVPRSWLGWLNILYTGVLYGLAIATILAGFLEAAPEVFYPLLGITVANILVANLIVVPVFRFLGAPADQTELRHRVGRDGGKDFATTVFKKVQPPSPTLAWSQYRAALGVSPPQPLVYGRVVEVDGKRVLQYWLFYYYNDWWNQHEADWEVVMVYLDEANEPVAVVCSSHLAGTWRSWRAVEPVGKKKDHPTVYVARGSHALYFNAADGMHYAVLHHPWSVLDFSGQFVVRGSKDAVGQDVEPPGTYGLTVIPRGAESTEPCDEQWEKWWWLSFQGRFGATDGIQSPPYQEGGLRWNRPVEWARDYCESDSGSWQDLFSAAGARRARTPAASRSTSSAKAAKP